MAKIENRFVVLSLLEDLMFSPIEVDMADDQAPEEHNYTHSQTTMVVQHTAADAQHPEHTHHDASEQSSNAEPGAGGSMVMRSEAAVMPSYTENVETVAEVLPSWEESKEQQDARVRALKHLPSLCVTMGEKWTHFEVVPYLQRCIAEDDQDLTCALIQLLHPLLLNCHIGKENKGKTQKVLFTVERLLPVMEGLFSSSFPHCRMEIVKQCLQLVGVHPAIIVFLCEDKKGEKDDGEVVEEFLKEMKNLASSKTRVSSSSSSSSKSGNSSEVAVRTSRSLTVLLLELSLEMTGGVVRTSSLHQASYYSIASKECALLFMAGVYCHNALVVGGSSIFSALSEEHRASLHRALYQCYHTQHHHRSLDVFRSHPLLLRALLKVLPLVTNVFSKPQEIIDAFHSLFFLSSSSSTSSFDPGFLDFSNALSFDVVQTAIQVLPSVLARVEEQWFLESGSMASSTISSNIPSSDEQQKLHLQFRRDKQKLKARMLTLIFYPLLGHPSWKVRWVMARGFCVIYKALVFDLEAGGELSFSKLSTPPRQQQRVNSSESRIQKTPSPQKKEDDVGEGRTHYFMAEQVSKLSMDAEDEVRAAAASSIGKIALAAATAPVCIPPGRDSVFLTQHRVDVVVEIAKEIAELSAPLVFDDSDIVRGGLATTFSDVCLAFQKVGIPTPNTSSGPRGEEAKTAHSILLHVVDLLRDESTAVQVQMIEKIDSFVRFFGPAPVEKTLTQLADKLKDCPTWRVRHSFISILPRLCLQFYNLSLPSSVGQSFAETREEASRYLRVELLPLLAQLLFDRTKAVRDSALAALGQLGHDMELHSNHRGNPASTIEEDRKRLFFLASVTKSNQNVAVGNKFINQVLWPLILQRPEAEGNYLARNTLIAAAFALNIDHAQFLFPQVLQKYCPDPIVNVRVVLAKKLLEVLGSHATREQWVSSFFTEVEKKEEVLPVLRQLVEDKDPDVRHFASKALTRCV